MTTQRDANPTTVRALAGPIETHECAQCHRAGPTRQIFRTPKPGATRGNRGWLCYGCAEDLVRASARVRGRWDLESLRTAVDAWKLHKHASDTDVVSHWGRCLRCGREQYARLVARQPTKRNPYARRRNRGRICRSCLKTVVLDIAIVGSDPYWDAEAARATLEAWPETRGPRSSDRQPASTP